jgi:hypothetical protein
VRLLLDDMLDQYCAGRTAPATSSTSPPPPRT